MQGMGRYARRMNTGIAWARHSAWRATISNKNG